MAEICMCALSEKAEIEKMQINTIKSEMGES